MRSFLHTGVRFFLAACTGLLAGTSLSNAQVVCDDEDFSFYGIGNIHNNSSLTGVYELKITNAGVTVDTANKVHGPAGINLQGLAIADLGSGKRFYSILNKYTVNNVFKRDVYMYNGSSWSVIHTDSSTIFPTGNAAGNGNYLYYHNIRSFSGSFNWPAAIQRFTGTGFATVLIDSSYTTNYPVADIAVDNSGNVYYFTGNDTVNRSKVTHLNVMSPAGVLLHSMPVTIDGPTLYGCFFRNNVLWVCCLGTAAVPYPHMIPVTIQGTTASVGASVAIPKPVLGYVTGPNSTTTIYLSFNDMASCTNTQIIETNAKDAHNNTSGYRIFPNPATNVFSVRMPSPANRTIEIYNTMGQLCYSNKTTANECTVDCSRFNKGLYLVKISSPEQAYTYRVTIE